MQRLSSHGRLTAAPITDERPGNVQSSSDNYWLHELSYSSLASNDSGYTQQPWLPDELCTHCMICQQRFDLWRWTHHCRDCGGLFCKDCSTHRVANRESAKQDEPSVLRVCDRCAFSSAHPEHLGCEHPFGCSRCSAPRDAESFVVYAKLFFRLITCCSLCNPYYWKRSAHSTLGLRAAANDKSSFQPPAVVPVTTTHPTTPGLLASLGNGRS